MTNIPDSLANFDWVSARAKCTPFKIFEVLHSHVQQDIQKRNLLPAEIAAHKTFSFQSNGNWFAVVYGGNKGIKFVLTENGIKVEDIESRRILHEGVLVMSDDGQCRLRVGSVEYDLWQFRKLALHDLFFVNREIVP